MITWLHLQYNLSQVIEFCWWRHGQKGWRHNFYFKKPFFLRSLRVANFVDFIKIATMFVKTNFKDSKKLKELKVMYENAIYVHISWYSKSCWFPVKKLMSVEIKGCITWFICFFDLLQLRYNCAKFHHCRICVKDFR